MDGRPVGQRNATDRISREFLERKQREREEMFLAGLRTFLDTYMGRFVLDEFLVRAGVDTCRYEPSASGMYWNEGRRNYGLEIKQSYEYADAERLDLLTAEHRQRQRQLQKELTALLAGRRPPLADAGSGHALTQDDVDDTR